MISGFKKHSLHFPFDFPNEDLFDTGSSFKNPIAQSYIIYILNVTLKTPGSHAKLAKPAKATLSCT